jgi:MFS family permease
MSLSMKKEFIPLLLLTLVNVLNFSIMIPVFPFIVNQYGGGSIMYGVLLAIFPIFQFFAAPVLGAYSDLYGRRPVLLISQAGTLLGWVIFASAYFLPDIYFGPLALPLLVIMLARVADGITGGNNAVANAYLIDLTKPEERAKTFGYLGGAVGIGLILGPAIGGYSSSFSIHYLGTGIVNIVISVVTLLLMYLYLPETLDKNHRDRVLHLKLSDEIKFIPKLMKYAENRAIKYLFFIRAFFLITFNGYGSILVLFLIDRFKLSQKEIGYVFIAVGCFLIFNQMVMVKHLAKRFGNLKTFVLGQIIFMIAIFTIQYVQSIYLFIAAAYFTNLGFSISFPTFKTLLSNQVEPSKQGEIQGIDESFVAAGSAIAPILAGILYHWIGAYTFGFFSVCLIPALYIFVTRFYRKGQSNAA